MVQFADPEVIVFAGGECLEKYGTLFKRTRPGQDLETVTAPEARYFRDPQNVIRAAEAGLPAVDWIDYDGTGRRPVVVLERDVEQLVEFSIPGGTPSDWELQELDGAGLPGEFGVQHDVGDNRTYDLLDTWDPNDFDLVIVTVPSFDSVNYEDPSGGSRNLFMVRDGTQSLNAKMAGANSIRISGNDGAAAAFQTTAIAAVFDPGDSLVIGVRNDGGDVTGYFANLTRGDVSFQTGTCTIATPFTTSGSSWQIRVGYNDFTDLGPWSGAIQALITTDGSDASPITDRFNAGSPMPIGEWNNLHSDKLVFFLGGNTAGSAVVAKTADGTTPSVTRGSVAKWTDWTGLVQDAATNVLRNRHRIVTNEAGNPSRRVTLLEPTGDNQITTPEDLGSGWGGSSGDLDVTDDDAIAPDGDLTADKLIPTVVSGTHWIHQNITITADGVCYVSAFAKPAGYDYLGLMLYDSGDTGHRIAVVFDLTDGSLARADDSAGDGVILDAWAEPDPGGGAYFRLYLVGTVGNSATTVRARLYPCDDDTRLPFSSWSGNGTDGVHAWGFQADAGWPGSYVNTTARAEDYQYLDVDETLTPDEEKTIYLAWVDTGQWRDAAYRPAFVLTGDGGANGEIRLRRDSGQEYLEVAYRDTSSQLGAPRVDVTPAPRDFVEVLIHQNADLSLDWEVYVNGSLAGTQGDMTTGTCSAFSGTLIARCYRMGLVAAIATRGDYTRAQMMVSQDADIFLYRSGELAELDSLTAETESKGGAFPLLDGFGGPSGVADASIVTVAAQTDPIPYDAAIGTKIVELVTGPAGTSPRSYRFGLPGQLNGLVAGEWVSMAVGVFIPSDSGITASSVKVAAVDSAGETVGDAAVELGAWNELYVAHQVDAGATEAYLELRVHDGEALGTADEVLYFRTPTVVARKCQPRPYANAAEGTVSLSAEQIRIPFPYGPRAFSEGFTVYGKVLERGVFDGGEAQEQIFQIGRYDSTGSPRLIVRTLAGAGTRGSNTATADGDSAKSDGTAAPSLAEVYEFALRVFPDSSVQLLERVAGGVVLEGAQSGNVPEGPIPSSWSSNSGVVWLTFGGLLDGNTDGFQGLLAGKVVLGTDWTMDQLEAADAVVETAAA